MKHLLTLCIRSLDAELRSMQEAMEENEKRRLEALNELTLPEPASKAPRSIKSGSGQAPKRSISKKSKSRSNSEKSNKALSVSCKKSSRV